MTPPKSSRWDVVVAAVTALVYAPTLAGGVVWDDEFLTIRNTFLEPSRWGKLVTHDLWVASAKEEPSGYYRPFGALTFALNRLLANEPWSYHLGNVVLHALVAVALRRLILVHRPRATFVAAIGALAFSLAPIATESVEWIAGRFDLLGTLFLLLGLIANARKRSFTVIVCFAAAMFSKETLVVAPVLFLLDDVLNRRFKLRPAIPKYVALGAVGILYMLARRASHVPNAAVSSDLLTPEALRAYVGCVVLYAKTLARITGPSVFHVYHDPGVASAAFSGAVLFVVTAALALQARRVRRVRVVAFAWIATLLALVPVGLTAPRLFQTGDRYAYLPAALFVFGLCTAIASARSRAPIFTRLTTAAMLLFALTGIPAVLQRHHDWRDEETLFRIELARDPSRYWAAALLGEISAKRGDYVEAESLLLAARTGMPRPYRAETALCYVYLNEGRLIEAHRRCDAALAIQPDEPRALTNRANVRLLQSDFAGALDDSRHAVRVKPGGAEAHVTAAEALRALGRIDEARAENDLALALSPGYARALRLRPLLDR